MSDAFHQADLDAVVAALKSRRFSHVDEAELQRGIAEAFDAAGIFYAREVKLGSDRLDFLADGIAIEVKVDGANAAVARQLERYAEHPEVGALVLATTRRQHAAVPVHLAFPALRGKSFRIVWLGAL